ncbi:MAG: M20/M25/M40 family metallo-hydrolase [Pirellulaceae bacterium]|nr:M20/M25/M40 family metallo-hydrolase [Pirellulaceae bacterium]
MTKSAKPICFRHLFASALVGLMLPLASWGAETAAVSEARLRETVTYLSSDELEGRGVGTKGIDKAADFIADHFAKLGLKTDLFDGTPFQKFEVNVTVEMGPPEKNRLTLIGPAKEGASPEKIELKLSDTFTPLAVGGTGQFDAPLVFAGYGITAKNMKQGDKEFTYDDYAGLDVKGKVVIVIRKEPQQKAAKSVFNGDKPSQHAIFRSKLANASEHGAAAIILVNDGLELEGRREKSANSLAEELEKLVVLRDKLKAAPAGEQTALAAEIQKSAEQVAEFSRRLATPADAILAFTDAGDETSHPKLPVFFATRGSVDELVKKALGKDLATLEKEIDGDLVPRSAELTGWRAEGETQLVQKKAQVKNVVGVLEGEGPHADETIVIGAHYDHLGLGGAGSLAPWTTDIHNGADDNASGTATLLEMATRLATSGQKPKHRIVFMAFTAEERGLLGSAYYVRNPRFPLESTIAMFNLDMVGRLKDDNLAIYGTGTAKEFEPLVDALCAKAGFKLTKHAGGFGPSDHSSFYGKKIPVLHLFTGTHTDYHRPSDDAPKLNIEGMRRVTDLLSAIVEATDGSSTRPTYIEVKKVEQLAMSDDAGGDRPSFGSMPAYPNPVDYGVMLEAVIPGSAAEKGGVKGGDVLIKFGESKITVLEDFESALRKHKPGDKVKVVLKRGQETIETEVTLTRRRM